MATLDLVSAGETNWATQQNANLTALNTELIATTAKANAAQVAAALDDDTAALAADSESALRTELNAAIADGAGAAARVVQSQAKGMICIVADDGYTSAIDLLMPAVEAVGGRMTFAIPFDLVGDAGKVTAAQLASAVAAGHEVAAQGVTNTDMTSLTATTRRTEWDSPITDYESAIGVAPKVWTYPYSARNKATDLECFARYGRAFYGATGRYATPLGDPGPFALGRLPWTFTTHGAAMSLVQLAAKNPVRAVIYAHNIGSGQQLSEARMNELISLAGSLGVPLVTLSEAFPPWEPYPDPFFAGYVNSTTDGSWPVSSTGTGLSSALQTSGGPDGYPADATWLRIASTVNTSVRRATSSVRRPVDPGVTSLVIGCKALLTKTSGAGSAKLICIEYGPDASVLATTTVDEHTATTVWDDLEGTVTLNADTVAYSLAVELNAVEGNAGFTGMRAAPPKSTFLA